MSKQILPAELAEIVTTLLTNPSSIGELDSASQHRDFMRDIGVVVANYCGGDINGVHPPMGTVGEGDEDGLPMLSVSPNDALPSLTQNVWAKYDRDGWDGQEPISSQELSA